MEYSLLKESDNRYNILNEEGAKVASLIKRREQLEGRKYKISWMLINDERVLRRKAFGDRDVALNFYKKYAQHQIKTAKPI